MVRVQSVVWDSGVTGLPTWSLSPWGIDTATPHSNNWRPQPVLTVNGVAYRFPDPNGYLAILRWLRDIPGMTGPLDQYIADLEGVRGFFFPPTPKPPTQGATVNFIEWVVTSGQGWDGDTSRVPHGLAQRAAISLLKDFNTGPYYFVPQMRGISASGSVRLGPNPSWSQVAPFASSGFSRLFVWVYMPLEPGLWTLGGDLWEGDGPIDPGKRLLATLVNLAPPITVI